MKKIVNYLLIAILAATIAGCGANKERDKKSKDGVIPVRVETVKPRDMNKTLEYVGDIKGDDEAVVYPKVTGKVIEKVKEEGSQVKKGEAIVYIDRDEVGLKFEKAPVESPLEGVVGRVYVDIGSSVTTETKVALVTKTEVVEIDLDVPEAIAPKVSIGQKAEIEVDAYPGHKFTGVVSMISPVVDLQTRTAPIELIIDNKDGKLQSGMFARVILVLEVRRDVPVIRKEAVIGRKPDTYVYVVEGDTARFKKVELGIRQGAYYEVLDGLNSGDRVVIMGQQKLRDGAAVSVEE